jgi:glycosyltransferase involved in cell wall biosynthesis
LTRSRQKKLNFLILNKDLPVFPGRAGHEYLHTTHLTRVAQRVGLVSLVHEREQEQKKSSLIDCGVWLYLWRNPHLDAPVPSGPRRSSLLRRFGRAVYDNIRSLPDRPLDTIPEDRQFRNLSNPIQTALSEEIWQALLVVQSSLAHWIDYLPRMPASVLVLHDVRALVYRRRSRVAGSVKEWLSCLREYYSYSRFEARYCRAFDLVITVSSSDEAWVAWKYRPRKLLTIPIPIDVAYFVPLRGIVECEFRIVFTGLMNHPPNTDAAVFFAREVLPRIQRQIPQAEFWIVGRNPTEEVRRLIEWPGVVVTGFVEDIRPYVAEAAVVVVPLRFGSGMRNKILEGWAMEKCIVSTRIGAEGLDYQDGLNILIADDAETLAHRTVQVLKDPTLRSRLKHHSRQWVATNHDASRNARSYCVAVQEVLQEKRQRSLPVRTLIDLRWMKPGIAGGIETLSRSFLQQLMKIDGFNHYRVLLPSQARYDFTSAVHPNFRMTSADGPLQDWRRAAWRAGQYLHRRLKIDYWRSPDVERLRTARGYDCEVALSMSGYIQPDLYPLENVLIVPDIQHEFCPEFFTTASLAERRRVYGDAIRRARHICAISEFTRQTLLERMNVPADRVTTTPLAADPIFHPGSKFRGRSREVLASYGLTAGSFLFFPGNTWPHKNHRTAFAALRVLRDEYKLDPLLVCTGSAKEAHSELLKLVQDLDLSGQVRFLGYCPVEDMPGLYEGAAALVFPSIFEGFGIPLTEAMWCDCPIVSSNATSLPEIAGNAALLVDPRSPGDLAHALSQVLTDGNLRRGLIENGRLQVKQFSWHRFTLEIVRTLYRVREQRYSLEIS